MAEDIKQHLKLTAGFSEADFNQLAKHGIPLKNAARHFDVYNCGIAKTILDRPALVGDGILKPDLNAINRLANNFDSVKDHFILMKFVPASGAASRMFKFLTAFLNDFDPDTETINAYINRRKATDLTVFFAGVEKFPFYDRVLDALQERYPDYFVWDSTHRKYHFIKMLLEDPQFCYSNKPKGVLPFHQYAAHTATPIEEHLHESLNYATSNGIANLHFTVSDSHQAEFEDAIQAVPPFPEYADLQIKTTFSYQDPATDTVAAGPDNKPLRDANGQLVLRPGGHGALLQNLNALDADLIFIKNIDNVVQDHFATIALYKKVLGGILIELQNSVFKYLKTIDSEPQNADLNEIAIFLREQLNVGLTSDFTKYTSENKLEYVKQLLNRPLRVCGMVKNEGETGGGPFWIRDRSGRVSLQIVETSQIDMKNPQQAAIVAASTHFNPVDIVCGIRDYNGARFNLNDFCDAETGFIVNKNKNGTELKAYELPGLWNGAMANWNTVFVEVPLITFNPVKTVNDLLKPAHQPQ